MKMRRYVAIILSVLIAVTSVDLSAFASSKATVSGNESMQKMLSADSRGIDESIQNTLTEIFETEENSEAQERIKTNAESESSVENKTEKTELEQETESETYVSIETTEYIESNTKSNETIEAENNIQILNVSEGNLNGEGTEDFPYLIYTEDDLIILSKKAQSEKLISYFELKNDIELTSENWIPIGNSQYPFSGTFDGNGHKISGLVIKNTNYSYAGLFGYNKGTIWNLTVEGNISGANDYMGGICGMNYGTVRYCGSSVTVSNTGKNSQYTGGLVGYNDGTVDNSYASGKVSSSGYSYYTGGLVGYNDGTLRKCYASGLVNGGEGAGLSGRNSGNIKSCYYNESNTYGGGGIGASTSHMKTQSCYYGWDFESIWEMKENGYPVLNIRGGEKKVELEGSGSAAEPYLISSEEELYALSMGELPLNKSYQLTRDIELTAWNWIPIGGNGRSEFSGTFDGNGHKISGLVIKNTNYSYAGLFGYNKGTIRNLLVEGSVSGTANSYMGGLCGYSSGIVECCGSSVDVSYKGNNYVYTGSLAGKIGGIVEDCYAKGKVSSSGYAQYVGGLVGSSNATISNCYSTGNVSTKIGGLLGKNNGTVTSSYYCSTTSSCIDTGKGEPLTKAQMKVEASFEGWDFINVWSIYSTINDGYPFLLSSADNMQESNDDFWYEVEESKKGYALYDQIMKLYLKNDKVDEVMFCISYIKESEMNTSEIKAVYDSATETYTGDFNIEKGISEISSVSAIIKNGDQTEESKFVSSFWYQMPLKVEGIATVKLPEDIIMDSEILFKLMNDQGNCVLKQKMNGLGEIVIHALVSGENYTAVLYANNQEYASKTGIVIKQGDKTDIDFSSIPQMAQLKLEFYSNGNLVTGKEIRAAFLDMTDGKSRLFSTGTSLKYLLAGDTIGYRVVMNDQAKLKYRPLDGTKQVILTGGENIVKIELIPYKTMEYTGVVVDAESGKAITDAIVSVSQTLNGLQAVSTSVSTNRKGEFTVSVKDDKFYLTISKNGYMKTEKQCDVANTDKVEQFIMERSSGKVELISYAVEAVLESEAEESIQNTCLPDLYEVFNMTQNKKVTFGQDTYPLLYANNGTLRAGDKIRVTVKKSGFADAITETVVNDKGNVKATSVLYKLGGIQVSISRSDSKSGNLNQYALYNANGKRIRNKNLISSECQINLLEKGEYSLVVTDQSTALSQYGTLEKMQSAIDVDTYDIQKITVENGVITQADSMQVPSAGKESIVDRTESSTTLNTYNVLIGDVINVRSNFVFFDSSSINKKLSVNIPSGTKLIEGSLTLDGQSVSGTQDGSKIMFETQASTALVRYSVKVLSTITVSDIQFSSSIKYEKNGTAYEESVSEVTAALNEISIVAPAETVSTNIVVKGAAPKNTEISIYDSGVLIGTVKSNKYGVYRAAVTLLDTGLYTVHSLRAETADGIVSETIKVVYGITEPYIVGFSMTHNGKTYELATPTQEIGTIQYSMVPSKPFYFTVNFSDNENVVLVQTVISLSNGSEEVVDMTYNEGTGRYEGKIILSSSRVPTAFSVDYISTQSEVVSNSNAYRNLVSETSLVSETVSEDKKEVCIEVKYILDDADETELMALYNLKYDQEFTPDSENYIQIDNDGTTIYQFVEEIYQETDQASYVVTKQYILQENGKYICFSYGLGVSTEQAVSAKSIRIFETSRAAEIIEIVKDLHKEYGESGYDLDSSATYDKALALCELLEYIINDNNASFSVKNKARGWKNELDLLMQFKFSISMGDLIKGFLDTMQAADDLTKQKSWLEYLVGKTVDEFQDGLEKDLDDAIDELQGELNKVIDGIIKKIYNDKEVKAYLERERKNPSGKASSYISSWKNKKKVTDVKTSVDPSGYVYETFSDNRLKGVTATVYFENDAGYMEVWDAEEYSQINPQITGDDGSYAWDVPEGLWQVVYSKDGYETVTSEKMTVPPPRVDVNIAMVSNKPAAISKITNTENSFTIIFDKYIQVDSITRNMFEVLCDSKSAEFELKIADASIRDYEGIKVVKSVELISASENLKNIGYTINVKSGLKTYAGVSTGKLSADYTVNLQEDVSAYSITIPEGVNVYRNNVLLTEKKFVYQNDIIYIETECPEGKQVKNLMINNESIEDESYYTVGNQNVVISVEFEERITISMKDSSVKLETGDSKQLSINEESDDKDLIWTSSDESVVTVDSEGKIKAISSGLAIITVSIKENPNVSASCVVTVAKKTEIVLLKTPVLSSVSNTSKGVTVKWAKVTGAAKYRVFRKSGSGSWAKVGDTTSTSYTDTTAKSGITYTYSVRCLSSDGKSYTSSYDKTGKSIKYLAKPKLASVSNTASGVTLKWAKVTGASGYYVYRKNSSGNYSKIATIKSGSTLNYKDTAVKSKNGKKYIYTVRAYSGKTLSSYENGKTIVRLTSSSISSLKNSASKKMAVKWTQNSKATGYQVQYSTSSKFSNATTKTITGYKNVSKTITNLKKGKTYYVRVCSYKTVSGVKYYSGWSTVKSVKISK